MKQITRRVFVRSAFLTAVSASFLPGCATSRVRGRVVGPNEEIRVAVVGFRGRGADHIRSIMTLREKGEKVRLVALCDADRNILEAGVKSMRDKGVMVQGYMDMRDVFASAEVDAVTFATPNHWHALGTVWAVQAGKDVYVEKPVSHNVWEGRKAVDAARKYGRIVQAGTQSRSSRAITEAVAWVRAGNLGKIKVSRGLCYKRRRSIGKVDGPQPIPEGIDYNLWCGPAPMEPLMRKNLHYDWHWVWQTGNGDIGNQGIHQMDIARWFLGEPALAPRVVSVGGRLGYIDDGETPNTQIAFFDYPTAPLIFEVRGLPERSGSERMDKFMGASIGNVIHCEGGYIVIADDNVVAYDNSNNEIKRWHGNDDHFANFLKAVRSRKHTDLNADILEGHISSALCHMANISYRLGRKASPADIRAAIKSERDAEDTFQRMLEHLKANDVDVTATPLTLGPVLKMNPRSETFPGNAAANKLVTRNYRPPFVVPARV